MSWLDDEKGKNLLVNGVNYPQRKNLEVIAPGAAVTDSDSSNKTTLDLSASGASSLMLSAQSIAARTSATDGASSSLVIAENELAGRAPGGNVASVNLSELSAVKDETVAFPGFVDVQSTTRAEGNPGASHTVALSLGDGNYVFLVKINCEDNTGVRYRQSWTMDLERVGGVLTGAELLAPVAVGSGDSQTVEPSLLTFSDSSGDLLITVRHTVAGRNLVIQTSTSYAFVPALTTPAAP